MYISCDSSSEFEAVISVDTANALQKQKVQTIGQILVVILIPLNFQYLVQVPIESPKCFLYELFAINRGDDRIKAIMKIIAWKNALNNQLSESTSVLVGILLTVVLQVILVHYNFQVKGNSN